MKQGTNRLFWMVVGGLVLANVITGVAWWASSRSDDTVVATSDVVTNAEATPTSDAEAGDTPRTPAVPAATSVVDQGTDPESTVRPDATATPAVSTPTRVPTAIPEAAEPAIEPTTTPPTDEDASGSEDDAPSPFAIGEGRPLDDAPTEATARPTNTPTPAATATAEPTNTPTPAATAEPTNTPTARATAESTSTPEPDATATPAPRATAEPTNTPAPRATAVPTSTPEPRATAVPTATAEARPTSTPTATPVPTGPGPEQVVLDELELIEGVVVVPLLDVLPTNSATRVLDVGIGDIIQRGDTVLADWEIVSLTSGNSVSSTFDLPELPQLLVGGEGVPSLLSEAMQGKPLDSLLAVVYPLGMRDLPVGLDPNDAYVIVIFVVQPDGF